MSESKVAPVDDNIKEELTHTETEVPQDNDQIEAEIAKAQAPLLAIEAPTTRTEEDHTGEVQSDALPAKMGESLDGSAGQPPVAGQPLISSMGLDELRQPESEVAKKHDEPTGACGVQHNGADIGVSGSAPKTSETPDPEQSKADPISKKAAAKAAAKKLIKPPPSVPKAKAKRSAKAKSGAKSPAKGTLSISAAMSKAAKR